MNELKTPYLIEEVTHGEAQGNEIDLAPLEGEGTCTLKVSGQENKVSIGTGNYVHRILEIGLIPLYGRYPQKTETRIGANNFFNGNVYLKSPIYPGRRLFIGDHNLFAGHILIQACNSHGIFDKDTLERINVDQDVYLGDENWVCKDVEMWPKAYVAGGSVLAAHAFVNRRFEEKNVLIAGIPAEVKRRNILWSVFCDEEEFRKHPDEPLTPLRK